jgi:hypothetical protein
MARFLLIQEHNLTEIGTIQTWKGKFYHAEKKNYILKGTRRLSKATSQHGWKHLNQKG